jgi:hypothetical protein
MTNQTGSGYARVGNTVTAWNDNPRLAKLGTLTAIENGVYIVAVNYYNSRLGRFTTSNLKFTNAKAVIA